MNTAFQQYSEILSSLARSALAGPGPDHDSTLGLVDRHTQAVDDRSVPEPDADVRWGVPVALLLLEDAPERYPALVAGIKRLAQWAEARGDRSGDTWPKVADAAGHCRDVYGLLILHLHLVAFALRYESLPAGLWGQCQEALPAATSSVRWIENYATEAPPPGQTAAALWSALCLFEQAKITRRDVDLELVDAVVHQIIAQQGPQGSLHAQADGQGVAGSLDVWTYQEMCGLHALANLAVQRPHGGWTKRVEQIALYHLQHTQPDHVTTQPWGVFAFLWSPRTRTLGLQQIHDASAQGGVMSGQAVDTVAGMLMADAVVAIAALCG